MTARYFHGGVPGLRVGDLLLPPSESGAVASADCLADAPPELRAEAARVYRRDRVYLTTEIAEARLFAALHPSGTPRRGGDVYQAEPLGDIAHDPDYRGDPGGSICCPSARIVAIVATGVRRAPYAQLLSLPD